MADDFTTLNLANIPGGDQMDETSNVFLTAPFIRKKPRIVLTGEDKTEIARVLATNPTGTEYGLVTRSIPAAAYPGTPVVNYGTVTLVPSSIDTTISTYTVPVSTTFYTTGFVASGDIHGKFQLYVNGLPKLAGRSSVAQPTLNLDFNRVAYVAVAGDVVTLKITHFATGLFGEFEGTILGYII